MSDKKIKRVYKKLHFDMDHPHWAICDVSNPPASGFEEAVVLKNKEKHPHLTPTQQAILEEIGEEYKPIEKSLGLSNTPSSSAETGDDNKVLEGNELKMTEQSPEFLALKQQFEDQKKEIEILKATGVVAKSIAKYALPEDVEKSFSGVLVSLSEEARASVYAALDVVVEKASVKEVEAQKSADQALDTAAQVSAQLVADLTVEKGHSDKVEPSVELTDVEKALEIIKQKQAKKGAN